METTDSYRNVDIIHVHKVTVLDYRWNTLDCQNGDFIISCSRQLDNKKNINTYSKQNHIFVIDIW